MYTTDITNVRTKPSRSAKVVCTTYWNEKVKVLDTEGKWCKVLYKGKERYIFKKYLSNKEAKYKEHKSPSGNAFKSCEPAGCITDRLSLPQGRLKQSYRLDRKSGVYMVGDRYCVALGSYYTTKIGAKVDLVLSYKGKRSVLKCILADQKANRDTIKNHRVHLDGSVAEFVVNSNAMPRYARYTMGDVSYAAKQFKGKIVQIRVYK